MGARGASPLIPAGRRPGAPRAMPPDSPEEASDLAFLKGKAEQHGEGQKPQNTVGAWGQKPVFCELPFDAAGLFAFCL